MKRVTYLVYAVACSYDTEADGEGCDWRGPVMASDDVALAKEGAREEWNRRAAITRDREQGRAETERYREALEKVGDAVLCAADIAEADDRDGVLPRLAPLESALKKITRIVNGALSPPLGTATTGTKEKP
jgi:hypothetical protein